MATKSPARTTVPSGSIRDKVTALLIDELQNLASAAGERAASVVTDQVDSLTRRLTEYATHSGDPGTAAMAAGAGRLAAGGSPLSAAVKAVTSGAKAQLKRPFGSARKGRTGQGGKLKVTNIVESVDVGVPVRVAYNQWTQFEDFPGFMKKVENVERESDQKLTWRAQIFWSHRTWESSIIEQVPDERIVWRSTGQKGSVDGSVSFHALTPNLTRIIVVLEYHPQGFFEHTGNLWRAQGRRARLELKHFVRHAMTRTALHPEEVEGWRGEIRDGEVVRDHESVKPEEEAAEEEAQSPPSRRSRPGANRADPESSADPESGADPESAAGARPSGRRRTPQTPRRHR
jgi:uncharacterized membrane protein